MSSDVIAGLNSAQFTNDNKHFYAYSGAVDVDQTGDGITLLSFVTNSEYIVGTVILGRRDFSGDDITLDIEMNGVKVGVFGTSNYNLGTTNTNINFIFPPHTLVRISARNISSSTARECYGIVTGKVGMAPKVLGEE